MTNFVNWVSPDVLRTLGWTLLHFIWQGAGLAALFAVATAVCRSAPARYALAVSALVLMLVSPVITFTWLRAQGSPAVRGAGGASTWAGTSTRNAIALSGSLSNLFRFSRENLRLCYLGHGEQRRIIVLYICQSSEEENESYATFTYMVMSGKFDAAFASLGLRPPDRQGLLPHPSVN